MYRKKTYFHVNKTSIVFTVNTKTSEEKIKKKIKKMFNESVNGNGTYTPEVFSVWFSHTF